MFKEIVFAIQCFFKAHKLVVKHNLWRWILIPGILYCVLFATGMYAFGKTSTLAIDLIRTETGLQAWLDRIEQSWLNWLIVIAQIFIYIILFFFYFSLFKYVFLIIGSPLFAYLSEKTESIIEGKEFPFSFSQFLLDVVRGVKIALRNLLWQSVYLLSLLILSFVPLVGLISPLLALLVECYYLGFSMLDYSSERHKLNTAQSIHLIGKHKGLAIGNGLVFYAMHLIPILGWLLAPCYAVIAATLSIHSAEKANVMVN
jgi:CysZ protein